MRTFNQFLIQEGLWSNLFKQKPIKNSENPEFAKMFQILLKRHNGNKAVAESELDKLLSTPAGVHQAKRMNMEIKGSQEEPIPDKALWRANSLSGQAMFTPRN